MKTSLLLLMKKYLTMISLISEPLFTYSIFTEMIYVEMKKYKYHIS